MYYRGETKVQPHKVADIFAGAGGLSYGFRDGFRTIWAFEWNSDAATSYRLNHGLDEAHVHGDVQEVNPDMLERPNVLVGGPPCQDFTQLRHVREDQSTDRNDMLWTHYLRFLETLAPEVFVIENVPNMLRHPEFDNLRRKADSWNYHLAFGVLNAADYGVPQERERAFVIGAKRRVPFLPPPTPRSMSAWEAIATPPGPMQAAWLPKKTEWRVDELHIGREPSVLSRLRYRYVPEEGNRRNLPDAITIRSWVGKAGTSDGYGRIYLDGPSPTIRCEPFKPEKGRYLHPWENRALTLWEAARLQTFPDDYVFYGTSQVSIARQIGNAVPPGLANHIAKAVKVVLEVPETVDLSYLQTPAWDSTKKTSTAAVLRVLRGRNGRFITVRELATRAGTKDWRSALRKLANQGYDLVDEGYGAYALRKDQPVFPEDSQSVLRLRRIAESRVKHCQDCGSSKDLAAVVLPWTSAPNRISYDNVRVLCHECRQKPLGEPDITDVLNFISAMKGYQPVRVALAKALGISEDDCPLERPEPIQDDSEENILRWASDHYAECFLCNRTTGTAGPLKPSLIRKRGLRRPENVWVLCQSCQTELESASIMPSRDKLVGRFGWSSFLTPHEARQLSRVVRLCRVRDVKQRLLNTFLSLPPEKA